MEQLENPDCGLEGSLAKWGALQISQRTIRAHIPDDPQAAQAVLRLLYHLDASEHGGILVHASGVVIDGKSVIAVGQSGAGKSTFARLNCEAIGADLLSDEIVALFPDGTVAGTPFRSNYPRPGQPLRVPLAAVFVLNKAGAESITPVSPATVLPALMAQTYRAPVRATPFAEVLGGWSRVLEQAPTFEFAFRKDPAAASFLRDWLRSGSGRAFSRE